jgi:hypothetical protein
MSSLLPYNSTKFEKDVEKAIAYDVTVDVLSGFKFKAYGAAGSDSIIGSSVTLGLDWEYSLAQVNIQSNAVFLHTNMHFRYLNAFLVNSQGIFSFLSTQFYLP